MAGATDSVPAPQAVTSPLTPAAIFLVLTVEADGEQRVRDALGEIAGLRRSLTFRRPDAAPEVVIGFGAAVWSRLFDAPAPAELHPFIALDGGRHQAPSTPGDVLLHVQARDAGVCFELADKVMGLLGDAVVTVDEVHGFQYFDRRNLLGFVDGTENPEGDDIAAATVIEADDHTAGGSYVIVQKYLHDLDAWAAISVEEQERVVGRTKLDDVELGEDEMPTNSHVALTDIDGADGEELDIYRANMPFGSAGGERGTYFIGYANRAEVLEEMLRNMFLGDPPGNYDRLLDFSTAVTGNLFFVPSQDFLDDPPAAGPGGDITAADDTETETNAPETTEPEPTGAPDGSLGIGALK